MTENSANHSGPKFRILIIEDNSEDCEILRLQLQKLNLSHSISVFQTGENALEYLKNNRESGQSTGPHLIFLDLRLPGEHGLETLKKIRGIPECKEIPIIVITASDNPEDFTGTYRMGGTALLKKPWDTKALREIFVRLKIGNRLKP